MKRLMPLAVLRAWKASGKKHLLITGSHGSGKTTLFDALASGITCGIRSKKESDASVTMADFTGANKFQIGVGKANEKGMNPILQNIETLGVRLLQDCITSQDQIVAIDEIGYLECDSHSYCDKLLQLFSAKSVLACVRKDKFSFLEKILLRDDAFLMDLDKPVTGLCCIVLASGLSLRFGSNKLLAPLAQKPVIAHTLERLAQLRDVFEKSIVVTRYDEIATLCEIYKANFVLHDLPFKSDTVRIAVEAMGKMQGYLFCQADQPLVTEETLTALALSWQNDKSSIWRLSFRGETSSPVIFSGKFFHELRALPRDNGGSAIIKQNKNIVRTLEAKDKIEVLDLDEATDLARLEEALNKSSMV